MITRDAVLAKLREIKDPCSVAAGQPLDLVEMGLIGELEIAGGRIRVPLVLTEPVCWFTRDIISFVEDKLRTLDGVEAVEAFLDEETIWTPDRLESRRPLFGPRARPAPARAAAT